ncbi:MAG: aminoglycoside phosphotransferase family protein [Chloroflexi bacterium]|nr:aminoglycoside phosphotransferase family protein [Chloroflexota bacterium]
MHRLTVVDTRGQRRSVVLRRWLDSDKDPPAAERIRREARLLAFDAAGTESGGAPALLMTRVPGHVHLTPRDPDDWLRQMASILPRIHAAPISAPAYELGWGSYEPRVPDRARDPAVWRAAIAVVQGQRAPHEPTFIHADYQHFNLLWSRERLTGLVDWVFASVGPRDVDVGHCRLNLAILFSPDWAERFRQAYEAEAGRKVDPWWDLAELLYYSADWETFIPLQVGRRAVVDRAGMTERVEDLLVAALRRL